MARTSAEKAITEAISVGSSLSMSALICSVVRLYFPPLDKYSSREILSSKYSKSDSGVPPVPRANPLKLFELGSGIFFPASQRPIVGCDTPIALLRLVWFQPERNISSISSISLFWRFSTETRVLVCVVNLLVSILWQKLIGSQAIVFFFICL